MNNTDKITIIIIIIINLNIRYIYVLSFEIFSALIICSKIKGEHDKKNDKKKNMIKKSILYNDNYFCAS